MENDSTLKEKVYNQILLINDANGVFDLFSILGYPKGSVLDLSSKRKKSTFDFKKEDNERINEIYSVLNIDEKLPVFLLETSTLAQSFIRSVTNTFDKQYIHYLLVFTINYNEITLVFPDKEKVEVGRHKLKLTKLSVDKEDIKTKKAYYSVIETITNLKYENKATWREVWKNWKEAFSVERVTKAFFVDYKEVFFELRKGLQKQGISSKESHEFTLQFLNRIMFIYFISKKDWLEEQKFFNWIWSKYRGLGKYNSNEFYEKWLKQVFLKAFNNRGNEVEGLPDEVVRVTSNAPYLNGGLFRENGLDNLKILITDKMFQKILEFFESYNFTIKEDMPLESEVAVDPQMIGYVYESLANVAEEIYDRNDLGIFYTPRVEVDFMCRRSLVEYLSKNMAELPKEKFYHLVFDPAEDREKIEGWFTKNQHWRRLEDALNNLSVVDPACGSGAFLVGMLNVVSDSYRVIYKHIGNSLSDFALKNRVIQYSLYGVDVMPWAIHAAELRLWLQLIVETEFKKEELRQHPLLPNLNLNLKVGDSLVQEIGGISFNLRTNNLKEHLKKKLEALKQEKRKYFENSLTAKFKSPEEVKEEEVRLFEEIIDERVESLATDIQVYDHNIVLARSQKTLAGEQVIDEKKVKENQLRIDANNDEINKLKNVKNHLDDPEKKPFVWDIDFTEIFGDKGGFDIVIGNPPYVTRTYISPPNRLKKTVTKEERDEYKDKLLYSVKTRFPVVDNISKQSDYYVYFYFHGLGLLNEKGTFCFITSSSWLDVKYGKDLQEFLCKFVPILAIYDNPKRSFAHADINTIIALFGSPVITRRSLNEWIPGMSGGNKTTWPSIKNTCKFVMFKKPFEGVLSSENLISLEKVQANHSGMEMNQLANDVVSTNEYRIFPIKQEDLLKDGWEYPEDTKKDVFKSGNYEDNKWGGKFLRAPDVFYQKIITKLNSKINDKARVTLGLTSGYNPFFYIKKNDIFNLGIEPEYLEELIKSPKDCKTYVMNKNSSAWYVLNVEKTKNELAGTNVLKYILEGEKDGIHKRPYFENKGKDKWYKLNMINATLVQPYDVNIRHFTAFNSTGACVDKRLVCINPEKKYEKVCWAYLNSIIGMLMKELFGKSSLGEGALDNSVKDVEKIPFFSNSLSNKSELKINELIKSLGRRQIMTVFEEVGIDQSKPIREQEPNPLPDRAELDNIIFDELELTQDERNEVYWSVCEMVKQRIDKARSLRD